MSKSSVERPQRHAAIAQHLGHREQTPQLSPQSVKLPNHEGNRLSQLGLGAIEFAPIAAQALLVLQVPFAHADLKSIKLQMGGLHVGLDALLADQPRRVDKLRGEQLIDGNSAFPFWHRLWDNRSPWLSGERPVPKRTRSGTRVQISEASSLGRLVDLFKKGLGARDVILTRIQLGPYSLVNP